MVGDLAGMKRTASRMTWPFAFFEENVTEVVAGRLNVPTEMKSGLPP